MASLKDKNTNNTAPAFESEEDGQTVETSNVAETVTSTETAVTVAAAATGVAVARPKLEPAFAGQNGYFPLDVVESLSLAVPRVKGEQGSFFKGQEVELLLFRNLFQKVFGEFQGSLGQFPLFP